MDAKTAFTSIAIISLVTNPANYCLTILAQGPVGFASLDRIRNYLTQPSRDDSRLDTRTPHSDGKGDDDTLSPTLLDTAFDLAISIDNVTIRPSPTAEPILEDVNLKVRSGSMVMISGVVGTGKTSLAKAILGDIRPDCGTISVASKRIAYCAQTPWLPNDDIKNIICGPVDKDDVDEQWFNEVVFSCGLQQDISILPYGDRTLIGSRGITLSGGQRQRVALARAVYSRLPIVILDDVLSALDKNTEHHVAEHLLGSKGLFRRLQTTAVVITHSSKTSPLTLPFSPLCITLTVGQPSTID